jgi:hypothetical protein
MAWTTRELAALNKSIAAGVTQVRYSDRTIEYRSLEEMLRIRTMMMDELGVNVTARSVTRKLGYSKGIVA